MLVSTVHWSESDTCIHISPPSQASLPPHPSVWVSVSAQSCLTLCDPVNYKPARLLCPWDSPGNNSGVACHFLLQWSLYSAAAKSLQSCPTLCDPIDGSPPVSPVPGILQARTLEWVAISFSNAWKWKVKGKLLSRVWVFSTPWTSAHQAPPSMGFSRQECWSGVPLPFPQLL